MDLTRLLTIVALAALVGILGADWAYPQSFEQRVDPFPVKDTTGAAYDAPFLGGLNTPRPRLVDIDADNDLDLFIQERRGRIIYFENTGTPERPQYEWRTDHFQGLDVGAWFRFGDLDNDGDLDLLAEEPVGTVRYYRNDGSPEQPDFVQAAAPLRRADSTVISADRQSIPVLVALDCTGPPDLLLGGLDGRLRYLEHTGTQRDGIPVFQFVSAAYQDLCVGPPSVCGPAASSHRREFGDRHGANALAAGDLGDDGDPDLLWGDFFNESLYVLENKGSCSAPEFEQVSDRFPNPEPVRTSGYNVPHLADLNNNGILDLLVGVLGGSGTGTSAVENLLYFNGKEAAQGSSYVLQTRRFVSSVDVGGVSTPAFVDLDADGDQDLVVGNNVDPGGASARLHVFRNTARPGDPAFRQQTAPLLPGAEQGFNFDPAFADVTGDGAADLFLGTFSGTVRFYRNVGGAANPQFERAPDGDVQLPRGNYATPALVDIDADGDQDLFVGSAGAEGTIAFYRNEGTAEAPDFTLVSEAYKDLRAEASRTHPAFATVDGDGGPDLYLGSKTGIDLYTNTGTPQDATFEAAPDSLALPLRTLAAPAVADASGDGRTDLVVGGDGGGLKFFAGQQGAVRPPNSPKAEVRAIPNPFAEQTALSFALEETGAVALTVYDVLGRRVAVLLRRRLGAGAHTVSFQADGKTSGMYVYVLRVDGRVRDRGRLLLVR